MPQSMRERCARAICLSEGVDPDMMCGGLGKLIPAGEQWPAWKVRLPQVDAVLATLTEPSKEMLKAMQKAMSPKHRPTPERVSCAEKHKIRYKAAIEAARELGKE